MSGLLAVILFLGGTARTVLSSPHEVLSEGRHIVDYGDHPFDALQQGRRLQGKGSYEPLRIHLRLKDLTVAAYRRPATPFDVFDPDSATNFVPTEDQLEDLIENIILPAKRFIESTVSVVRAEGGVPLPTRGLSTQEFDCYFGSSISPSTPSTQPGADLAIRVSAGAGAPNDFSPFPFARTCSQDQYDRPITGYIDLTEAVFDDMDEGFYEGFYKTMIHELFHLLGMSRKLFAYWYDPTTGLPRSPRPLNMWSSSTDQCQDLVAMPSETTIRMSQKVAGELATHFELVTPTVQAVAQNQFNCSDLDVGGRLERFGNSCVGSHWNSRWFATDLMSDSGPSLYQNPSVLIFAAIEDTGWYQVNYTDLEPPRFGRGGSCEFLSKPCIVNQQVPQYGDQFYCSYNNQEFAGCVGSDNGDLIGLCNVRNITRPYYNGLYYLTPREENQYFHSPDIGAYHDTATDFCPTFHGGSLETVSIDVRNCSATSQGTKVFSSFEKHGPGAKCVESNVPSGVVFNEEEARDFFGLPVKGDEFEFSIPLCMDVRCNVTSESVEIHFGNETRSCSFDGEEFEIPDMPGHTVKCPRRATTCREYFCPKNCAGRGVCDYSRNFPKCLCNDPSDPSPWCANSPNIRKEWTPTEATSQSPSLPVPTDAPSQLQSLSPSGGSPSGFLSENWTSKPSSLSSTAGIETLPPSGAAATSVKVVCLAVQILWLVVMQR